MIKYLVTLIAVTSFAADKEDLTRHYPKNLILIFAEEEVKYNTPPDANDNPLRIRRLPAEITFYPKKTPENTEQK